MICSQCKREIKGVASDAEQRPLRKRVWAIAIRFRYDGSASWKVYNMIREITGCPFSMIKDRDIPRVAELLLDIENALVASKETKISDTKKFFMQWKEAR